MEKYFTKKQIESDFRVALCSVPVEGWGAPLDRERSEGSLGIVPKVAIVALVKWMLRHDFTNDNWDFIDIDMLYPTDDFIIRYFETYRPHVVGLSAVVSTSYTQVKRISHLIRKILPETLIVMGGNLAASSEAVLVNTDVDITIVGDGEVAWVKLLKIAENVIDKRNNNNYIDVPGVCLLTEKGTVKFTSYGEIVPNGEMFLPDYEILEQGLRFDPTKVANYFRPGISSGWFDTDKRTKEKGRMPNVAGIFASKGCVAKCTFCQRATKGYRIQPYEELEDHLILLKEKYNVGFIQILDENFGSNKKHSYEFAQKLWKHDMLWMATGVRCTSITEEDILFYKKNGCAALKFGVESGSQTILDLMEKVFKISDVYNAINYCTKHGVYSPLAVMVGMPGETEETAAETGRLIGNIAASMNIHPKIMGYDIFYALPLPGTPLYEYGELVNVIEKSPIGSADYLARVTNAGTYKRYYVNLNGAPVSEVLFWDVLVALEASRTFNKKVKEKDVVIKNMEEELRTSRENEMSNNSRFSLKYSALQFTIITWIIDNNIIGNKIIDKIPEKIIYPIIKLFLYIEYIVQKNIKFNQNNNIFIMDGTSVKRIKMRDMVGESAKSRSLRGIVNRMQHKENEDFIIVKNNQHLIDTSKLFNRNLLSKGL